VLLVAAALGVTAAASLADPARRSRSVILVRNVMCGTWVNGAAGRESGFFLRTA
jgi:hypothetical protein